MKNKSVIIEIFAFVVSFFLFTFNVKADNIYTITSDMFSHLNNISTIQDTIVNSSGVNFTTYPYYIIYYGRLLNPTRYRYFVIFRKTAFSVNAYDQIVFGGDSITKCIDVNDLSSFTTDCGNTFNYRNPTFNSNYLIPLYSNIDIPFNGFSTSSIYTFNYDTKTYSVDAFTSGSLLPTLYDLNIIFNSDDTPLLSSFVTLVVEKLAYMCEFFTSSYIYLSMFVIFILYFVIFLFRRVKNV